MRTKGITNKNESTVLLKQPPIATLTSYVGFSKYIDRTEDRMEQAHHV